MDAAERCLVNKSSDVKPTSTATPRAYGFMNPSKRFAVCRMKQIGATPSLNKSDHTRHDDASLPLLQEKEASVDSKHDKNLYVNGGSPNYGPGLLPKTLYKSEESLKSACATEINGFAFPVPLFQSRITKTYDLHPLQEEPCDTKELCISHEGINNSEVAEQPAWDRTAYVLPETSARSVSMRDMGTEMTPITSQEPSRTGTPIQCTTPSMRSPVSSGSSTPKRGTTISSPVRFAKVQYQNPVNDPSTPDKDGTLLEPSRDVHTTAGKKSVTDTTRVHDGKSDADALEYKDLDGDPPRLLKRSLDLEEVKRNVLETRAAAWEEAERARYEREEAKIQAWEKHEKAKAEAEMRRIEVKIEKIRAYAQEKLMNKLAATKRRAEEQRAIAEARQSQQARKAVVQSNQIREGKRLSLPFLRCTAFCS
ncbi:hypothetical protein KP509_04G081600 [Ceratopteris richardii]|uniref:Remorin C-terminal domain-containing protein n=1 Tax=Ceratopteris richardii TaxID=49495 RepID=A0A8T2UUM5_CERRI|nr:hypothetical protein KP509_04G081600 [Ceratopteris richardii]